MYKGKRLSQFSQFYMYIAVLNVYIVGYKYRLSLEEHFYSKSDPPIIIHVPFKVHFLF